LFFLRQSFGGGLAPAHRLNFCYQRATDKRAWGGFEVRLWRRAHLPIALIRKHCRIGRAGCLWWLSQFGCDEKRSGRRLAFSARACVAPNRCVETTALCACKD